MSYIGNTQQNQSYVPAVDFFNGNGSTTAFTLSKPVASVAAIQVVVSNVSQKPGDAYTVSGSTITFTSAPPSGTNNVYVYYTSPNNYVMEPGQGTVSTNKIADGAVTASKLAAGAARSNFGAGAVLQVVSAAITSDQATTSTSYVDVTGLSAVITPSSATSKILVRVCINNMSINDSNLVFFNLLRGSTSLISNTSGGSADAADAWASGGGGGMANNERKISSAVLDYIDSPASTSSLTYKVQMRVGSGGTGTINRWQLNTDNASVSTITLMEIAA